MPTIIAAVSPGDAYYEPVLLKAHALAAGDLLTVLAMFERPLQWSTDRIRSPESQTADARQAVVSRIRQDLDRLGLDRVSTPIDIQVPLAENSNVGADIVAHAQRVQPDLIVVGTHGRTGMQSMFVGSVAEHIVRHADCDVYVVRSRPAATTA